MTPHSSTGNSVVTGDRLNHLWALQHTLLIYKAIWLVYTQQKACENYLHKLSSAVAKRSCNCYVGQSWPDGSVCYRTGVRPMGDGSLHCWNRDSGLFRLLWPWPWPDDHHIRTSTRHTGRAEMNVVRQCFRKLSYLGRRMRAFNYAWSLPVTWKKMAVMPFDPPYSKTTCKPDGSIFYRTGVVGDQILHCWNKNVGRYRLRWPSYTNLTRIAWRYIGYANMKFVR